MPKQRGGRLSSIFLIFNFLIFFYFILFFFEYLYMGLRIVLQFRIAIVVYVCIIKAQEQVSIKMAEKITASKAKSDTTKLSYKGMSKATR